MAIWIITSVAICLFMILIIYQRRPIIKKYLPLTANKNFCLDSGVFLLFSSSGNIEFEFIKNLGLRVIVDKKSFDLCFANISSYHIYPNKIIWKLADNKIVCTADKISLGEVGREFCFDFDKPKFSYNFDTSRRELVLGMEKFRIKLSGFEKLSISPLGNNRLRVKGKINSNACFDFVNKCVVGTRSQVCEFKQKNFAIYDTTRWQFSFNVNDNKSNALKRAYIAKNIKLSARKIEMPQILNFASTALQINFEAKSPIYINLENLGLGKLIQIKLRGCVVTVSDLLTGLSYRIIADKKIISKQICVFGINYLYLSGWNGCVNFTVKPLNQANSEQYLGEVKVLSNAYSELFDLSFDNILKSLNLLVLHGFFVDVLHLVKTLNYKYFSIHTQFLLSNLVLSFVVTFDRCDILSYKKVRNLLVRGLCCAMSSTGKAEYCFCKKFLILVKSEKAYQRISLQMLKCLDSKEDNGEYILSEILGITLRGEVITIKPKISKNFVGFVLLRGVRINLCIKPNWSMVKINNLCLGNIYSFDISKLEDNTLITFD